MENNQQYQYSLFKTPLGWFGVLGCERGLVRTCLPVAFKEAAQQRLLAGIETARSNRSDYRDLEKQILAYYKGKPVDFSRIPIYLNGLTAFQKQVLMTLRSIKYGRKVSYGDLARRIHNPRASRAIGSVMAKNPLPLIIPCHRVIKTDGSLGYFSAAGGIHTKKHMLDLENRTL